ncbi:MAG: TMEM175 family protein [Thermoleophilia bacterium]
MPAEPAPPRFWLKINRIEALADGIFAIAMTLLVLGLEVPQIPHEAAASELFGLLSADWPRFEDYALSFLLLAMFWITHHRQFHLIRRVNNFPVAQYPRADAGGAGAIHHLTDEHLRRFPELGAAHRGGR